MINQYRLMTILFTNVCVPLLLSIKPHQLELQFSLCSTNSRIQFSMSSMSECVWVTCFEHWSSV